jgi:hypothetical protein
MKGIYSGYEITFCNNGRMYRLNTKNAVKGCNYPVEVTELEDGSYTATLNGKELDIDTQWQAYWEKIK